MQEIDNKYSTVIGNLSQLKALSKFDKINENIYLYNKSAYVFSDNINCKIDFLDRKFESITKIPFGENFESSIDAEYDGLSDSIAISNEKCRMYCDTLFYINKVKLLNHISSNYNSIAKINKINLTIELNDGVTFKFEPKKKSVSVFPCEYRVDTTSQLCPNFRIEFGQIKISALLFYQVLSNDLIGINARVEINTKRGFLRVSCISESINTKFVIDKIQE